MRIFSPATKLKRLIFRNPKRLFLVILFVVLMCLVRLDIFILGPYHAQIRQVFSQDIGDKVGANGYGLRTPDSMNKTGWNTSKSGEKLNNKGLTLVSEAGVNLTLSYQEDHRHDRYMKNVTTGDNHSDNAFYQQIPPVYDQLIKVTMDSRQSCKDADKYDAVIAVHTAPDHFRNREMFRWLYGNVTRTSPRRYKLLFFIGQVANTTLNELLHEENENYDDMIQGNYMDAYINMTYKAIMVFNYLDKHCKGLKALFRVDDDVYMNINQVFDWWSYVRRKYGPKSIMCYCLLNDKVLRSGKWAVPRTLIPQERYEFMRCPGYFVAVAVDLIHDINVHSRKVPFFWIDDIVLLGLVPQSIGGVYFYPFTKWMSGAPRAQEFERCMQTKGPKCQYWVGVTNIDNFEKYYGYMSGQRPLVKE